MAEIAGLDIDGLNNNGVDIDGQFSSLTVKQHTIRLISAPEAVLNRQPTDFRHLEGNMDEGVPAKVRQRFTLAFSFCR